MKAWLRTKVLAWLDIETLVPVKVADPVRMPEALTRDQMSEMMVNAFEVMTQDDSFRELVGELVLGIMKGSFVVKSDLLKRRLGEGSSALEALVTRKVESALNETKRSMEHHALVGAQEAITKQVSAEFFVDEIVARILRRQIPGLAATKEDRAASWGMGRNEDKNWVSKGTLKALLNAAAWTAQQPNLTYDWRQELMDLVLGLSDLHSIESPPHHHPAREGLNEPRPLRELHRGDQRLLPLVDR